LRSGTLSPLPANRCHSFRPPSQAGRPPIQSKSRCSELCHLARLLHPLPQFRCCPHTRKRYPLLSWAPPPCPPCPLCRLALAHSSHHSTRNLCKRQVVLRSVARRLAQRWGTLTEFRATNSSGSSCPICHLQCLGTGSSPLQQPCRCSSTPGCSNSRGTSALPMPAPLLQILNPLTNLISSRRSKISTGTHPCLQQRGFKAHPQRSPQLQICLVHPNTHTMVR